MKHSLTCPKCQCQEIIHVPRIDNRGNNSLIQLSAFKYINVDRYVCGRCGFSEEWINDAHDLAEIKAKYELLTSQK